MKQFELEVDMSGYMIGVVLMQRVLDGKRQTLWSCKTPFLYKLCQSMKFKMKMDCAHGWTPTNSNKSTADGRRTVKGSSLQEKKSPNKLFEVIMTLLYMATPEFTRPWTWFRAAISGNN